MPQQALAGLKVVECGGFSAAQCTKLLADLGAEVIKVEGPEGDELRRLGPFPNDIPDSEKSGVFLYLNSNKLGVTLNLRAESGKAILREILKTSDVLVEDNSPAVSDSLGLTYDKLSSVNPRLIVTSITPFGRSGPYRDYKAYDLNILATGGGMSSGAADREPLKQAGSQGFIEAGVHAAAATLVAVLARSMTGQGQQVDIVSTLVWPLFQGLSDIPSYFQGQPFKRSGHRRLGNPYPVCILPVKDGHLLLVAVQGFQWKRFLELMGGGQVPEWYASDPRFRDRFEIARKYADEMDERISPWLMSHTKEEIFAACRERHIPYAPVYTAKEVMENQHLNERGVFTEIDHPEAGKLKYPGRPYVLTETPWRVQRPAPRLGENNEEVYCTRLGYSKEALVSLRRTGVI